MSNQLYQQRLQGNGVHMLMSVSEHAAQFILAKDVGDGPLEGLAITLTREALDHLRLWLGVAAENTAPRPVAPPEEKAEDPEREPWTHEAEPYTNAPG